MSDLSTIEHVSLEKNGKSAHAFVAFWADGRSRVSEWTGSTWFDRILPSHEEGINLAAEYVRRGYACTSILTGEVA